MLSLNCNTKVSVTYACYKINITFNKYSKILLCLINVFRCILYIFDRIIFKYIIRKLNSHFENTLFSSKDTEAENKKRVE